MNLHPLTASAEFVRESRHCAASLFWQLRTGRALLRSQGLYSAAACLADRFNALCVSIPSMNAHRKPRRFVYRLTVWQDGVWEGEFHKEADTFEQAQAFVLRDYPRASFGAIVNLTVRDGLKPQRMRRNGVDRTTLLSLP